MYKCIEKLEQIEGVSVEFEEQSFVYTVTYENKSVRLTREFLKDMQFHHGEVGINEVVSICKEQLGIE